MTVTYSQKSIWALTPQNNFALGYWVSRDIPLDDSDMLVRIDKRHQYQATHLSYDLYGSPAYWWTFSILNPDIIKDPIRDFAPGTVIRCATLARLQKIVG